MKRFLQIALAFFVFAVITGAAQAQFRMQGPSFAGVWNPEVGSGGVYEVQTKKGTTMTMEIAVVGKETVHGKQGYWMENDMKMPNGKGDMLSKTLIVRDGADIVFERMIMQMSGRPPMDMSAMIQRMMHSQPADIRTTATDLGPAVVTTPAGTFVCEHYKLKDGSGDYWIKAKTGPYGLVKSASTTGTMTLTRVVTDAKDKITGTPQVMNPMGMGRPPHH